MHKLLIQCLLSAVYPQSAFYTVCSPQSTFYTDQELVQNWTITVFMRVWIFEECWLRLKTSWTSPCKRCFLMINMFGYSQLNNLDFSHNGIVFLFFLKKSVVIVKTKLNKSYIFDILILIWLRFNKISNHSASHRIKLFWHYFQITQMLLNLSELYTFVAYSCHRQDYDNIKKQNIALIIHVISRVIFKNRSLSSNHSNFSIWFRRVEPCGADRFHSFSLELLCKTYLPQRLT